MARRKDKIHDVGPKKIYLSLIFWRTKMKIRRSDSIQPSSFHMSIILRPFRGVHIIMRTNSCTEKKMYRFIRMASIKKQCKIARIRIHSWQTHTNWNWTCTFHFGNVFFFLEWKPSIALLNENDELERCGQPRTCQILKIPEVKWMNMLKCLTEFRLADTLQHQGIRR